MATSSACAAGDSLNRVIGAIYAAAVAPDCWPAALEQLRAMFDLGSTAYIVHDAERTRIDRIAAEFDPEGHQAQVQTLLRGSIFYAQRKGWYAGQIIRTAELVPNKVFHRSRMYQEYWRPRALYHGLRLTISIDEAGVYHGANLLRSKSANMFDATEIAVCRVLMPHLQRAVELRRRLRHADVLASTALATLDVLPHPVLLLGQDGRVLHANAAGEAMLTEADGLGARHGVLHAATQALTNRLHGVLARAAGAGGVPMQAGALRLPKRTGGVALAVLVMPFRHEAHWSLPRRPATLVCVTDPDAASALPGRQMIELFGLTGSEAALAADLLAGKELRDISTERGRSINTVRTQLARLMAKTDVSRQSELMRLLASLPRARDLI